MNNSEESATTEIVPAQATPPALMVESPSGGYEMLPPAEALAVQFSRVNARLGAFALECCRFGAMLEALDDSLSRQRYTRRDRGLGAAVSVKSWLEENCPDIPYATAKGYQRAAEGLRNKVGLPRDRPLLPLLVGESPVDGEQEAIRRRIADVFAVQHASMNELRRAAGLPRQGGALKGTTGVATGRRALTAEERSAEAEKTMRELLGSLGAFISGGHFDMLTRQSQGDAINALKHYLQSMNDRVAEDL